MRGGVSPERRQQLFMDRVDQDQIGTGCWFWVGTRNHKGYGRSKLAGIRTTAHRAAYTILVGPIPAGLQIDHLCRTHACVNPAHLEVVTPRENFLRGCSLPAMRLRNAMRQ